MEINEKWQIYTRGAIPLHRLDFFESLRKASLLNNKMHFCSVLYACEKTKAWWAWDKKATREWGDILIKRLSDKKQREEHYKKYEEVCKRAIDASEKVRLKNLLEMINNELHDLHSFLKKETDAGMGMPNIDLDMFDLFFEEILQAKIKECLSEEQQNEFIDIYQHLSAPIYSTFVSEEEKLIVLAALKNKDVEEDARKILNKFWWLSLGWENLNPRTVDYYINEIEEYSKKRDLKKIKKQMDERLNFVKSRREEIISKYGLSDEVRDLLGVFDKFAYLHDLRKEMQVRVLYSFNLLLIEVAKRFNINEDDREWYTHNEVLEVLKTGRADSDKIKKRKIGFLMIAKESGIEMFHGKEAIEMRKKELEQNIDLNVKEIRGSGVSPGVVRARACVCNGIEDARRKVRPGDVLITGMTLPDYVPVMKIAGAIITDEGGITCHAAIVSRELKKPCIVGTKVATLVLHDGDLIEVDANKGVIKIIKKNGN